MIRYAPFFMSLMFLGSACGSSNATRDDGSTDSQLGSFTIGDYQPQPGKPDWSKVKVDFQRLDGDARKLVKEYNRSELKNGEKEDVEVKVEFGRYRILLTYFDTAGKIIYESCPGFKTMDHLIDKPAYEATIDICPFASGQPEGQVTVKPASTVILKPVTDKGSPDQNGSNPPSTPSAPSTPSTCTDASGKVLTGFDAVYGQCIEQKTSWYVKDGEIHSRGEKVQLRGVNWFGMDGLADNAISLGGLWVRPKVEDVLKQLKGLGFNSLRIPLSPESFRDSTPGRFGYATALDNLKDLMRLSDIHGFHILLDIHNCGANKGYQTGTPEYCAGYYPQGWLSDLRTLAILSKDHKSVVGIDLYNEPHKLTWDQWRAMAAKGGEAVLRANPRLLVFVEGVGSSSPFGQHGPFWGANLHEAALKPVDLPKARLVFSPHTYGPSVHAAHDYFQRADFPRNMPAIWDEHFGHLRSKGYPIAIGEFGGFYKDKDKLWQDAFVSYLIEKDIKHFFYWSLNPESGDTGGLFNPDWTTVNQEKLELLKRLMK